jgi:hypothetical protein
VRTAGNRSRVAEKEDRSRRAFPRNTGSNGKPLAINVNRTVHVGEYSTPCMDLSNFGKTDSIHNNMRTERQDPSAAPWITDSVLPIIIAQRQQVATSAHR